ncbi:type II toxin-antitoxin system death-on-curing family toxin [Terriglobus saanensis]|uniref:Death-on-curing family protein n=1 Tax=Terriglobus saanensis (strain ATCC BAA-1853 / DSM 23119 / SP1PR4) TaxID=401053 RepID=E8V2Y1_TERSS|nr:type II toxin-antitoxin system death-on-curing family toxin [Terriglobus saanensis]ADV84678.1 death-on-curing family protein [Terriglobus saanensis SP1PR4]
MNTPVWIEKQDALAYHLEQLAQNGGSSGVRDVALLESALAKPLNLYAYDDPAPSMQRLAASYAFGIARNHPFVDGNKRTAFVVSVTFLAVNGFELTASKEDRYLTFLKLAEGSISEAELTEWFGANTRPADADMRP